MKTKSQSIIESLFSKTKRSVLGILFSKPESPLHLRELTRLADVNVSAMSAELHTLVESGILISWRDGNRMQYQANPECPIFEELCGIARKTMGVADIIKNVLAGQDIDLAFIFGSVATGKAHAQSDIDLLVVSDMDGNDLYGLLSPLEEILRRPIHLTHYGTEEWQVAKEDRLINKIIHGERITLIDRTEKREGRRV